MKRRGLFEFKVKYDGVPIMDEQTDDMDRAFKKLKQKMG